MENKVTADYLDEEGCLHCGTCGKRKQMKVSLMGFEHVVSCLCECEVKARQELDEKMQREDTNRQAVCRKLDRYEEKKCRTASDGTSWNREKFLCRLYCKCTFGTGRTCHDDKFFQDLK